jgi:single-stranded-DNA-specific exonuclease
MLVDFLQSLGIDIVWRVPMYDETYGLSIKAVEEFATLGGNLIITVDCGISNINEIVKANELGIDVIITDHHIPKTELPPAYAIVNPKLSHSSYPFRDLSGCMVAYKLITALQNTLGLTNIYDFEHRQNNYLQLAALGTIADIVPLKNENRIVVRKGLASINHKPIAGLSELLLVTGLSGKPLTSEDLAWFVSPVINASGRMGRPDKAVSLLIEKDPKERLTLAKEIKAMNDKRIRLGTKTWLTVEKLADDTQSTFDRKLILVADEGIHRGITGIMANRLIKKHNIPAMVVHFGKDIAIGSIRSPGNYDIRLLLEPLEDILLNYGGHENALGFSLERSLWEQFFDRLEIEVETISCKDISDNEEITVDAELPHSYITPDIFSIIDCFEPYGEGNQPIIFSSKNLKIINAVIVGKREPKHIKLTLDTGKYKWSAILWDEADRLGNDFSIGDKIDMLFTFNRNWYKGVEIPQIIIKKAVKSVY